jgi:two-component system sensor histidine kinase KdpD
MEEEKRPSPEELLQRIQHEEATTQPQGRGKLKIFLGYAAGVGKTYRMLEEAQYLRRQGVDVVVALVETHGRPETEALLEGLEIIPRKKVPYKGIVLEEMDLDAVLRRRPALALVDELAHTNAPGCRHAKRYQDVEELLAEGISVYTTLNIQHVESVVDIVQQITGVRVTETVPDSLLEKAGEIEVVDLPPEELLRRLAEGKVYIPPKAEEAMRRFFRQGNLLALREIALRYAARKVGEDVRSYMAVHAIKGPWPAGARLLVCVSPSPYSEMLVRVGARMARDLDTEWFAVYVDVPTKAGLSERDSYQLRRNLQLAETLGAKTVILSGNCVADTIVEFAQARNVNLIVAGSPLRPRWQERLKGSIVYELIRRSGSIHVLVIGSQDVTAASSFLPTSRPLRLRSLLSTAMLVAGMTLVCWLGEQWLKFSDIVLLMLFPAALSSFLWGEGAGVIASLFAVFSLAFFFVPPRLSLELSDLGYLSTFLIFLAVGVSVSFLTALLRRWERRVRQRERFVSTLYEFSRRLMEAAEVKERLHRIATVLAETFHAEVVILLPNEMGKLTVLEHSGPESSLGENEYAVATWVFHHGQPAGRGTNTLSSVQWRFLPLLTDHTVFGVVGLKLAQPSLSPEEHLLLEAFVNIAELALRGVVEGPVRAA